MTTAADPLTMLVNDFGKDIQFSHPLILAKREEVEIDDAMLTISIYSIDTDNSYDALEVTLTRKASSIFTSEQPRYTWSAVTQKGRLYDTIMLEIGRVFLVGDGAIERRQMIAVRGAVKKLVRGLPNSAYGDTTYTQYEVDPNSPPF